MTSFEMKEKEYNEKLSNNIEIVNSILGDDDANTIKIGRLLLEPKDEIELRFANSTLDFINDFLLLIEAISCDNVYKLPLEENEGVEFLIEFMKQIRSVEEVNDIEINNKFSGYNSYEEFAKLYYQIIVGLLGSSEGLIDYIGKRVGFNLDDPVDIAKFNLYLNEIKEKLTILNLTNSSIDNITEDGVNGFESFVNEFHLLCEKGIKNGVLYRFLKSL